MTRIAPPPSESKLVRQRINKLDTLLNRVAYGKLRFDYEPQTRMYSIEHGPGATQYGFRLLDGERFLTILEQHVVQNGKLLTLAYKYQLSWPNNSNYKVPDEWIFRFEYNSQWDQRPGFAGKPHLNIHHPMPVGPDLMHYPTPGLFPAELFFRIIHTHFPQKRR